MTVDELLRHGRDLLNCNAQASLSEVQILLGHVLNLSRAQLAANPQRSAPPEHVSAFLALVQRRRSGEPIAYLLGEREFWSLPLRVSPATLIPRPETELLVEWVLQSIPADAPWRIADLGTGSGAIALAIASERPRVHVVATDRSAAALAVARDNAARLGLRNLEFRQGDWCGALTGEQFHVIVSNPPYIADDDPHLSQGDLRFEPPAALSCGRDGLAALRAIAEGARQHLLPGGRLLMEHGYEQGPAVVELMTQRGYQDVLDHCDLAGIPRVCCGII